MEVTSSTSAKSMLRETHLIKFFKRQQSTYIKAHYQDKAKKRRVFPDSNIVWSPKKGKARML